MVRNPMTYFQRLTQHQIKDQVIRYIHNQVRDQTHIKVPHQVWIQSRKLVYGKIKGRVWNQVFDQVYDEVEGETQ
jgi:hypothetical protein